MLKDLQDSKEFQVFKVRPALKEHKNARDIVLEGYQEHHVADVLVGELHEMDVTDERWGAKFKVLKEIRVLKDLRVLKAHRVTQVRRDHKVLRVLLDQQVLLVHQ